MKEQMGSIITRIKLLRRELKMTQQEFADGANISYGLVMGIERGTRSVSDKTASLICRAYNVNEEWLWEGKGGMFVDSRQRLFEEFSTVFSLSQETQRKVAELIQFPLAPVGDGQSEETVAARRNVARLIRAVGSGSAGRVISIGR